MGADATDPTLDVVQKWFQAVISHPEGVEGGVGDEAAQTLIPLNRSELEKVIRRSKQLTAEQRLGVYANAYYARLMECLRESFPVLAKTLGREVFDEFAFDYLQRYPSRGYTLNRLGDRFADFLNETRPDRPADGGGDPPVDWPDFLIDLARLEWTIERVFDGPGVEGQPLLSAGDLRETDPARFAGAKLETVVCFELMRFRYPVNAYFTAARRAAGEEDCPPPPEPADQFIALNRRDYVVRRTELSRAQFALLSALKGGSTVGDAIAAATEAEGVTPENLRHWFETWTAGGLFQSMT